LAPLPPDIFPPPTGQELIASNETAPATTPSLRDQFGEAKKAWLAKSPSLATRKNWLF
jgi:hypothetical protein